MCCGHTATCMWFGNEIHTHNTRTAWTRKTISTNVLRSLKRLINKIIFKLKPIYMHTHECWRASERASVCVGIQANTFIGVHLFTINRKCVSNATTYKRKIVKIRIASTDRHTHTRHSPTGLMKLQISVKNIDDSAPDWRFIFFVPKFRAQMFIFKSKMPHKFCQFIDTKRTQINRFWTRKKKFTLF